MNTCTNGVLEEFRMLQKIRTLFFFAVALPLFAHHQFSSEFDRTKPLSMSGTVSEVQWTTPHTYIYLDVKNQSGKTEQWKLEAASSTFLQQHGLQASSFKKGTQLTVNAYGATNSSRVASARVMTMPDGKAVQVADPHEDGGPAK
jgi:hypothetical protein